MIVIYNNIIYNKNRSLLCIIKFLENNWKIIGDFYFCNLRHTCTPNVSPHVSVCTVVHIHVYENHEFCILKSGTKKHFITQSTWSQIILAATLLWLSDY